VAALIVDTSSWVEWFESRGEELIGTALGEDRVVLTPVVAAELASGTLTTRERARLLQLFRVLPLCPTDFEHWIRVGMLRARLRGSGLSVSIPDAHVAQCALDLDCELLAEDHIFALMARHVPLRMVADEP
jgi:predicted nucleic acid-binding protein